MFYNDTRYEYPQLPAAPVERTPKRKAKKAKRTVNYAAPNRPATARLHERMLEVLSHNPAIGVRELGEAVGITRQLALYHVKKLVAHDRIIAELAPCRGNGGVQYVLYTKMQRAVELGAWLLRQQGRLAA